MKEKPFIGIGPWYVVAGPPDVAVGSIYYNEHGGLEGTESDCRTFITRKIKEVKQSKMYAELEKHPDYEMYYLKYPDGSKSHDFYNKSRAKQYATLRSL